jgi:acyl-CoA reductase-like NAD-dependent aldehyde dehydrogenase
MLSASLKPTLLISSNAARHGNRVRSMATELSVSPLSHEVDIDNSPAAIAGVAPLRTEAESIIDALQPPTHIAPDILRVVEPATGELIASVFATPSFRVPAIVARAAAAAGAWGDLPFRQRVEPLARLRELVARRAREIAETIARGTGKQLIETRLFEVAPVIDILDECITHARDDLADEPIAALVTLPVLLGRYRAALLPRTPRGVVCVIARISSPFELAMTPSIIALTAGNAVIVKPCSSAALVGVLIERLLDEAFADFPGLAQVVHGARALGSTLTTCEGIDAVVFTPSTPAGRDRSSKRDCVEGPR